MKVFVCNQALADVVERDNGFDTPVGFIKLSLRDVLDILCDAGFESVKVHAKNLPNSETFEWETVKSMIRKLKKLEGSKKCGAIAIFVGFVRELNEGREVKYLEYEMHEELYPKKLEELKRKVLECEGVEGVEIFHRKGRVFAGEDIVYVAVMGHSRKHVWRALEMAVEGMKKELPVWKKEVFEGGEVWI